MEITAYRVAAFSDRAGAGSPTGVVLNADSVSDAQMQRITDTIGCSHTAFVSGFYPGTAEVRVRFFTPTGEITNCAHGTIAAHVVLALQMESADHVMRQRVNSGVQDVRIERDGEKVNVFFKQDQIRFNPVSSELQGELFALFGLTMPALGEYDVIIASPGTNRFLLSVKSVGVLKKLRPDLFRLKQICERTYSLGCFAFTFDDSGASHARMFAPAIGVDEDISNGNSSGCLGAYLLSTREDAELSLRVHQGQELGRPSTVLVITQCVGDRIETTVGGTAVIEATMSISVD
jgi:trans-2,3-dihydro-3-hydroxyanthranilate isomerase